MEKIPPSASPGASGSEAEASQSSTAWRPQIGPFRSGSILNYESTYTALETHRIIVFATEVYKIMSFILYYIFLLSRIKK